MARVSLETSIVPSEIAVERDALMFPYEHPYRQAVGATWREQRELRLATAAALSLWLGGGVSAAVGAEAGLIACSIALVATLLVLGWLLPAMKVGWRLARSGSGTSSLGTVRQHRPHAGLKDPAVAHDEFAVTAEDSGHLVTWRFRPLRVTEQPRADEREVPGKPRYAASPAGDEAFDALDVVRASEQLIAAQSAAAALEAAAADAMRLALEQRGVVAERMIETGGTAAALQRATGQRPNSD